MVPYASAAALPSRRPHLDGLAVRCRRQLLAIGREHDGADRVRMPLYVVASVMYGYIKCIRRTAWQVRVHVMEKLISDSEKPNRSILTTSPLKAL
jgi:hypothetical protein